MSAGSQRVVSPEWAVRDRADRVVVDNLAGSGWGVVPAPVMRGASYTDFSSHVMAVPHGDDDKARAVRLHEMIHARVSPAELPYEFLDRFGVTLQAVRIAEEIRVNLIGRFVADENDHVEGLGDVRDLADGGEVGSAKDAIERDSWNDALSLYLMTLNTNIHAKVKRALNKHPEWKLSLAVIARSLDARFHANADSRTMKKYPSELEWYATRAGFTSPRRFVWVSEKTGEESSAIIPSGFLNFTLPLAVAIDAWLITPPSDGKKTPDGESAIGRRETMPTDDRWASLRFGLTNLTETTTRFLGKRKRPAMVGKYPTRPDRILTDPDRRIFRETVRGGHAIVVFDCSGSMSVTHDTVHAVVKRFAGATVVLYTHRDGGYDGNAWIVAKNGRMVSRDEFEGLPLGYGNCVDGPILEWAVRQRKTPKDLVLWVCDGFVTDKRDNFDQKLESDVAQFIYRNRVVNVETPGEALELLSSIEKGRGVPRYLVGKRMEAVLRDLGIRRK